MRSKNKVLILTIIILLIIGIINNITYKNIILIPKNNISEIEVFNKYTENGAICIEGNILLGYKQCKYTKTSNINTNKIGTYKVTYKYKNKTITNKINVIDKTPPTITLKGDNPIYINKNETYIEPGYILNDNYDKNLDNNITITNNINTQLEGTYTVTYTVTDTSNNTNTIKREIKVINNNDISIIPKEKTIYLTFDDGPGRYTEELLNILKKYNVKATFFVTNQFSKYQYCIKKAYIEGHAIALHTYSHKWDIYKNEDTYFEDLNKISNIVKNQIGIDIKLIRFPGGSGNTVSKKYNNGIMTRLTKEVTNKGYKYFDWTITSGDTNTKSSTVVYNNVINGLKKNNKVNVILMHDIKAHTIEAVPKIIEYGLNNDFQFAILTKTSSTVHGTIRN